MSYWPLTRITGADTESFDAFGRFRVSQPQTLLDSKLLLDSATWLWDEQQTAGSGTTSSYSRFRASVTLSVGAATAGTRVRQTKRRTDYQPGKSQLIFLTFVLGAGATGITRRVGYFDSFNGIFLQQSGSTVSFVIRTNISGSPSDANAVAQSSWNVDKLDGTGPSGKTLDVTKSQIMYTDFEWLGVGRVQVGFVIDGAFVLCHDFKNANVTTGVYMSTPNLPLRYEISNSGAGGAASLECICGTVISEGGRSALGYERGVSRGAVAMTTSNNSNIYPVVALRLNGSYVGATVQLTQFSLACTSNSPFNWYWIENPTLISGSFNFQTISNSAVEADFQQTGTLSLVLGSGTVIRAGAAATTLAITEEPNTEKAMGSFINGATDVWVLAVQRLTGTTETFYGAACWREFGG